MTISVVITNMPSNGGSAITGTEYRINGGSPISLGATAPGTYATAAVLGDNVEIRAVNAIGSGPWSAAKNIPALGVFGPLATQAFTDNTGNQTYIFPAATGAGLTFTYALTAAPSGVTINSATRTITFDTDAMPLTAGATVTVTATDNLGRAATGSPRSFSVTIGVGAVNPSIDPATFADPGNAVPDTLTATVAYPGSDTLVAGVAIRNGGSALTNAQLKAGTGTFLERIVIDPYTGGTIPLTGFTSTSEAGTAIDIAVWEKNNGGLSNVQTTAVSGLDFTAPTFSSGSPADGATGVAVGSNLVATFSENVFAGSGLFRLRNTTANTQIETFNPLTGTGSSGGTISIAGAAVTLNPFADLLTGTNYAVRWDAGAVLDQDGNPVAANTGDTQWNFSTSAGSTLSLDVSDLQTFGSGGNPRAGTFDLSALTTGDKVIVIAGYGSQGGTVPECTVQGITATRLNATDPVESGDRNVAVWEVTLTGAGSASASVSLTFPGLAVNIEPRVGVFGFKNAGTVSQAIGSYFSNLSFSRSVTPTSGTNFIIALNYRSFTPTDFAWTGATQLEDLSSPFAGSAAIASTSNVPASAYAVGFTKTDTARGAIAVVCVNPL